MRSAHRLTTLIAGTLIGLGVSIPSSAEDNDVNPNAEIDALLVERLQVDQETREEVRSQMGARLTPEQIRALRIILEEEEAARHNPTPPIINNQVINISRGESPQIDIMERFDSTLVFADRAGNPLAIRSFRISDKDAAALVPLHEYGAGMEPAPSTVGPGQGNPGESQPDAATQTTISYQGAGPVTGLIVSPKNSMRSTNITVRVEGQDYPIILTVSTRPSTETARQLAYLNEIRLDWVVNMNEVERLAGKYRYGENIEMGMLSLLQGVPDSRLEQVKLEGELSSQMSLWRDDTGRGSATYYLRLAEHISPWNVAISDQSHDRMHGFTVIKINGAPPKTMGFSSNGQYSTVNVVE